MTQGSAASALQKSMKHTVHPQPPYRYRSPNVANSTAKAHRGPHAAPTALVLHVHAMSCSIHASRHEHLLLRPPHCLSDCTRFRQRFPDAAPLGQPVTQGSASSLPYLMAEGLQPEAAELGHENWCTVFQVRTLLDIQDHATKTRRRLCQKMLPRMQPLQQV